jgi:hypothetical protein
MPSSTVTLQSIVDYISSLGEIQPVMPTGGYTTNTACAIATDVMQSLISQRFNFKWNRMKVPPFYTNSWQQDYAQLSGNWPAQLGWIEGAYWVDINNTALPKPTYPIEAVRDLEVTSISGNPPCKVTEYPNNQLVQGVWPGPTVTYTNPLGLLTTTPTNPPINILDANGNILILTQFGVTGLVAPAAAPNAPENTVINDGSVKWTVVDPLGTGFRLKPLPPQQGVLYQVNVIGQMKAPAAFTTLGAQINPVPDDYSIWFRDGFRACSYQMSPNPSMQALYERKKENWLAAIAAALKQADREVDNAGFIPDRSVVAAQGGIDIGPANPFLYNVWPGR